MILFTVWFNKEHINTVILPKQSGVDKQYSISPGTDSFLLADDESRPSETHVNVTFTLPHDVTEPSLMNAGCYLLIVLMLLPI